MNYEEFIQNTWATADAHFQNPFVLVKHHIHSFEDFMDNRMESDIQANNGQTVFKIGYDKKLRKFLKIYKIRFENASIAAPITQSQSYSDSYRPLFPSEAREKNLTYAADLFCDISQELHEYDAKKGDYVLVKLPSFPKTPIGKFPIMVGSKYCNLYGIPPEMRREYDECEYDMNGLFIIKGNEKVLISQEQLKEKDTHLFMEKKEIYTCKIQTVAQVDSSFRKEIKLKMNKNNYGIKVIIKNMFKTYEIPLFVLFRALGITTDKNILEYILYEFTSELSKEMQRLLVDSIVEGNVVHDQSMALQLLFSHINGNYFSDEEKTSNIKIEAITFDIITKNLFIHLGPSIKPKIYFLGHMARRLLLFRMGKLEQTDRDSFINKGILDSGSLMRILFRNNYNKMITDLTHTVRKAIKNNKLLDDIVPNLNRKIKPQQMLESSIKHALSTGMWPSGSLSINQSFVGISQSVDRISYLKLISTLRRIVSPIPRKMKSQEFRMLHNTQWGYFCPNETPEGQSTGIVKTMSMLCTISIGEDPIIVIDHIKKMGLIELEALEPTELFRVDGTVRVFVNGAWVGIHRKPNEFYTSLKAKKRNGHINIYTAIVWAVEDDIIRINTEGGRLIRPMYIVENNRLLFTAEIADKLRRQELFWQDLITGNGLPGGKSIIEYLDVDESNTLTFAIDPRNLEANDRKNISFKTYTHCEIHPSLYFGPMSINVPFINHNQAARNVFQAAMSKQAIGIYATNHKLRMDTLGYVLNFPERQLVYTKGSRYVNTHKLPNGQNIIIAIASYTGYNQEDSLIINQGAIDRGLFAMDYFKTYKDEQKKTQKAYDEEKFMKPERYADDGSILTKGMANKNYDKLQDNGFVREGETVEEGDVIIGKVVPLENSAVKYKDISKQMGRGESGVVEKVYHDVAPNGYQYVKVKVRSHRPPIIGDKFCAEVSQKGTVAIILPEADMPYTANGIIPDIIVSPHGQIKRMTTAMVLEAIMGKLAAITGIPLDGTPFDNEPSPADIGDALLKRGGFSRSGKEVLYNGMTGEQMLTDVFIGPNYYYRLKHMVKDKIYARATGVVQLLTKQPSEGRSRGGGLRIGEMERDCLIAHGATRFLKEKMFDQSDQYLCYVCKACGRIAAVNEEKNIWKCFNCPDSREFSKVEIPYCTKLFIQEMNAQMSEVRLMT